MSGEDIAQRVGPGSFASTWVSLFQDLGGRVATIDGEGDRGWLDGDPRSPLTLTLPETNFASRHNGLPQLDAMPPHLQILSAEQWAGALRIMEVVAHTLPGGLDAIHAYVATCEVARSVMAPDAAQKPLTAPEAVS